MTDLQAGQNIALSDTTLTLRVTHAPGSSPLVLDASAYLLTASGKVTGDEGFLFYGQPSVAGDAAKLDADRREFTVQLARLPAGIERIAFALTVDQGIKRGQRFGQLESVVLDVSGKADKLRFALATAGMTETAVILGECYLRNGVWKFRAVGQGFNGGLGPLASHFGVTIKDDPDQAPTQAPAPAPAAAPKPAPAPTPAPAPPKPAGPPINLTKITLEKKKPISLQKEGGDFGEIVFNLKWTQGEKKTGWFSGGKGGIDLDLGCMLELADGTKTVIQALGGNFGNFQQAPWTQLMGDDRSGTSLEGEFLRVNGAYWKHFKRVLIYAFIYEGAPNWAQANGVVTVRIPGQPELVTHMEAQGSGQNMCAIAMLENVSGAIRATKLVEYFGGHEPMDQAYGFGFRWKAGSK